MLNNRMGLVAGAMMGVVMLGAVGFMLGNTKAARRRRMMKRAIKTAHNVGCAIREMTAF